MQSKMTAASNEMATERHTAVYAREARADPKQSSLEAQVEACVRQAAEDGVPPVSAAYVYRDQGSGLQLDHPGLNQLRRDVQAGEVGVLYARDPARLSRSRAHFALLSKEFASAGVEIRFVEGSLDTDLLDRLSGLVASGVYGYDHDKAEGFPTADKQEASTVGRIFKLADEGWTAVEIATYLNETEPPTERGR